MPPPRRRAYANAGRSTAGTHRRRLPSPIAASSTVAVPPPRCKLDARCRCRWRWRIECRVTLEAESAHRQCDGHARVRYYGSSLLRKGLEERPGIPGPIRRERMPDAGVERTLDELLPTTI